MKEIQQLAKNQWIYFGLLLLLSTVVIFYNLGSNSLHDRDEAKHALISENIILTGKWFTLSFNGKPYFSKPPLKFWLNAIVFRFFGVNEFTVRFWSGIFAVGTILVLYLLLKQTSGEKSSFFASLILLTSHQFIYNHAARSGETDAMLTFLWTTSLLFLLIGIEKRKYFFISFFLIGLCGMTKHLVYTAVILAIVTLFVFSTGRWKKLNFKTWLLGYAIVFFVAIPWHLAEWWFYGDLFLKKYFLTQVYNRAIVVNHHNISYDSFFYFNALKNGAFPWIILFPFALWHSLVCETKERRSENLLFVIWIAVILTITTLSKGKFTWYILPAYPAIAIIVGKFIGEFTENRKSNFLDYTMLFSVLAMVLSAPEIDKFNPFLFRAADGVITVDFFVRLKKIVYSPFFWVIPAVIMIATAGKLIWIQHQKQNDNQISLIWFRYSLVILAICFALYYIFIPIIRFSETKSQIHLISIETERIIGKNETVTISLGVKQLRKSLIPYYIRHCAVKKVFIPIKEVAVSIRNGTFHGTLLVTKKNYLKWEQSWLRQLSDASILSENQGFVLLRVAPKRL